MVVAESARRTVDGVGDEQVIAGLERRQQRQRRRCQARRNGERGVPAFECRERALKVGDGRQPVQSVREARILAARRALEVGHRRQQDRRRAKHRRVDRAEKPARIASGMRNLGRRTIA